MLTKNRILWSMVIFLSIGFVSGCRLARMAVCPMLTSQAYEMPVKGKKYFCFDESFHFGPYSILNVSRGWTKSTTLGIYDFQMIKAKQKYSFILVNNKNYRFECRCTTRVDKKLLDTYLGHEGKYGELEWTFSSDTAFVADFYQQGQEKVWKLFMEDHFNKEGVMQGIVSDGHLQIFIVGTRRLAGTPIPLMEASGYEFWIDRKMVGAVEVINDGAVWIHPKMNEEIQSVLATAASALLLYKNIGD